MAHLNVHAGYILVTYYLYNNTYMAYLNVYTCYIMVITYIKNTCMTHLNRRRQEQSKAQLWSGSGMRDSWSPEKVELDCG
jgi:NADH:ubiquinone oxidoreductase subunit 2 (subunit N)